MLLHISVLMHTRLLVFYCDDVHIIWASQVTLVVKNQPANAGNIRDVGSIPGSRRSLEEGMATHSRILAWRIPTLLSCNDVFCH